MDTRFSDEFEAGFGWVVRETLERASHVLISEGRAWMIDAVAIPGIEDRIRAVATPAGVIQLLDRHHRDCTALAERLGIPHHVVPTDAIDGAPFRFLRVLNVPRWREVALWWPEAAVLVWADALGTATYFRAGGERLAVHPLLRLLPPRAVSRGLTPRHVLCGHGEGIHGDEAAFELEQALATARRHIPRWLVNQVRVRR